MNLVRKTFAKAKIGTFLAEACLILQGLCDQRNRIVSINYRIMAARAERHAVRNRTQ
jgi:hypothetical protein